MFDSPVTEIAFVEELAKIAESCAKPCSPSSYEDEWLAKFKGSPLYEAAQAAQADKAKEAVDEARRDIERQRQYIVDSVRRLRRAELDAALSEWKLKKGAGKEKTAVVGPLVDAANLGIPSGVGYLIGKNQRRYEPGEEDRKMSLGLAALVPGYLGYHFGTRAGARLAAKEKSKKAGVSAGDRVILRYVVERFGA